MTENKERIYYVSLLLVVLVAIWLLKDFVLLDDEVFSKNEEYTFVKRTELEVKAKVKLETKRYQFAPEPDSQVTALTHLLECYYFQLFTRRTGMNRYFDFIKIVLIPDQRVQLKGKTDYTRQVARYLKRKKNLNIQFLKYEISTPRFNNDGVRVLVKRTMNSVSGIGTEIFLYHFRKHSDNRYYLWFSDAITGNTRYRMTEPDKDRKNNSGK